MIYAMLQMLIKKLRRFVLSYCVCLSDDSNVDVVFQLFSLEIYLNFNAIKLPQYLHAEMRTPAYIALFVASKAIARPFLKASSSSIYENVYANFGI